MGASMQSLLSLSCQDLGFDAASDTEKSGSFGSFTSLASKASTRGAPLSAGKTGSAHRRSHRTRSPKRSRSKSPPAKRSQSKSPGKGSQSKSSPKEKSKSPYRCKTTSEKPVRSTKKLSAIKSVFDKKGDCDLTRSCSKLRSSKRSGRPRKDHRNDKALGQDESEADHSFDFSFNGSFTGSLNGSMKLAPSTKDKDRASSRRVTRKPPPEEEKPAVEPEPERTPVIKLRTADKNRKSGGRRRRIQTKRRGVAAGCVEGSESETEKNAAADSDSDDDGAPSKLYSKQYF